MALDQKGAEAMEKFRLVLPMAEKYGDHNARILALLGCGMASRTPYPNWTMYGRYRRRVARSS